MNYIKKNGSNVAKLLIVFFPLAIICITIGGKFLGFRYWWLGFVTAQAIYAYLDETSFRGLQALNSLSPERIALNLKFAGVRTIPRVFPFQIRFGVLVVFLAFAFIATIRADLERGIAEIGNILVPEKLVLKVEYPAWTETPPLEHVLDSEESSLPADTASLLEVRLRNGKFDTWHLTLTHVGKTSDADSKAPSLFTTKIGQGGLSAWSLSVARVYELLSLDPSKAAIFKLTAQSGSATIYTEKIAVTPIGLPKVTLVRSSAQLRDGYMDSKDNLFFRISASSKTPLSQVELEAHTKSGYRFSRIAAEFAGSFERSIETLSTSLSLLGVPFAPKDTLFVRAVAKTIVPGIVGYSPEVEISVVSPLEVKQQIIQKLEESLKEIGAEKADFLTRKLRILSLLREAEESAAALGQRSPIKRLLSESVQDAGRLESHKDARLKRLETKLKSLLDAMKRSTDVQETMSLLARIQNLQLQAKRAAPQNLPRLASETTALSNEAARLKTKLASLLRDPSLDLTQEEKALSQRLLETDKTPEYLDAATAPLANRNSNSADAALEKASKEAQGKLGGVIQILAGARARSIRDAQRHLTDADKRLQAARSAPANNSQSEINSAIESLNKVPQVNKELQSALESAQEGAKEAMDGSKQGQTQKMETGLNKAQDGIVQALQALQDEEEMQNENQKEMDGTEHRAKQELLTAQGLLDASWRKRILEEISRLRSQGEATDSPLVRFLESKLR